MMNNKIFAIVRGLTDEELREGYARNEVFLSEESFKYLKKKLPVVWRLFFNRNGTIATTDGNGNFIELYCFEMSFRHNAVSLIQKVFGDNTYFFAGWNNFNFNV